MRLAGLERAAPRPWSGTLLGCLSGQGTGRNCAFGHYVRCVPGGHGGAGRCAGPGWCRTGCRVVPGGGCTRGTNRAELVIPGPWARVRRPGKAFLGQEGQGPGQGIPWNRSKLALLAPTGLQTRGLLALSGPFDLFPDLPGIPGEHVLALRPMRIHHGDQPTGDEVEKHAKKGQKGQKRPK